MSALCAVSRFSLKQRLESAEGDTDMERERFFLSLSFFLTFPFSRNCFAPYSLSLLDYLLKEIERLIESRSFSFFSSFSFSLNCFAPVDGLIFLYIIC